MLFSIFSFKFLFRLFACLQIQFTLIILLLFLLFFICCTSDLRENDFNSYKPYLIINGRSSIIDVIHKIQIRMSTT